MLALPPPTRCFVGGQGGDTPLPEMSRSDARMYERAINGRWPIDPKLRADVIATMAVIVRHPYHFDPRVVTTAAKVLLDADRINLEDEDRATKGPDQVTGPDGRKRIDFSRMSDDELDRYLESGGG